LKGTSNRIEAPGRVYLDGRKVMSDKEFYGTVEFSVSAPLTPWDDPGNYVHAVTGVAFDLSDEFSEQKAGEITMKLVCATEATNRRVRLFEVCDADSAILEAVYSTLFDSDEEIKEELDVPPSWNDLLFIEDARVVGEYEGTTLRIQLLETAIATFGSNGIIIAVEDSLDLSMDEWRELGFKRIANSPFVFRDQLKLNPYKEPDRDYIAGTGIDEASYHCESCGDEIVFPVDLSAGPRQQYVEDCPICCRPNIIHVEIDEDGEARVWAEPEQD
jgi:hypothetical protein